MLQALDAGVLIHYDSSEGFLRHRGKPLHVLNDLDGHLAQTPFVSIGCVPFSRELISLDPQECPLIEKKYQELVEQLAQQELNLEVILWMTMSFVKHEVFSHHANSDHELDQFLQTWILNPTRTRQDFTLTKEGFHFPIISIEDFAQAKKGVCRHISLVVAYFLDKLQNEESLKQQFPRGQAYVVRDAIRLRSGTRYHAWNLFLSDDKKQAWHIDATWEVSKNIYSDSAYLYRLYGEEVIEREKNRFLPAI